MEAIIRRPALASAPRRLGRPGVPAGAAPAALPQATPPAGAAMAPAAVPHAPLAADPAPAQPSLPRAPAATAAVAAPDVPSAAATPEAAELDMAALRQEALAAALEQVRQEQQAHWQARQAEQEQAHQEALAGVAETQRKLDESAAATLAAAREEGLAQGAAQALADARAQAAAELAQAIAAAEAAAEALALARASLADGQEDMLVEIAFGAVCRVLGAHGASRAGVTAQVRSLLAQQAAGPVAVHLHPDDAEMLAQHGGIGPQVQLSADPAVELGGCLLVSERGTLDARLEVQVEALRAALLAVRARRSAGEEAA
jgi:flagellar assembly protein FliH